MKNPEPRIYRFRISLQEIEPEIWRLIDVREVYTFWDLHVAIQDAMGWLDYHLHSFEPLGRRRERTWAIGIPGDELWDDFLAGWDIPIAQVFTKPGDTLRYRYDFGDGWEHRVELIEIRKEDRRCHYPRCVDGARACPPEDCGSVPGYYHLLEVLADPQHEEHGEVVYWLKHHAKDYTPYDPEAFDPAKVEFWDPYVRLKLLFPD